MVMGWIKDNLPWVANLGFVTGFKANIPAKFPINGQWMSFFATITSALTYVGVSLFTCREKFNMERMLHRGRYATESKSATAIPLKHRWMKLIGITKEFTLGDKAISVFSWKMLLMAVGGVITVWNLFQHWPLKWWSNYWYIQSIIIPLVFAVPTTIWFTWGGIRDLRELFVSLKRIHRDDRDDGTVVDHHNLDEPNGENGSKKAS